MYISISSYTYTYRYIHIHINIYIHTSSTATTTTTHTTGGGVLYRSITISLLPQLLPPPPPLPPPPRPHYPHHRGFMWDFQLNPKSSPLISMCVLHLHENMVVQHVHSTVRETQPLHTQQDKIVPRKHPITPPGISLALRESLRCGGTRPFSTLKKPSNKCKTTRQRSSKKSS